MQRQYLNVPFRQKDSVKALGARFDGTQKRWYVEGDRDLSEFGEWLPATGEEPALRTAPGSLAVARPEQALAPQPAHAISLSRLLNGVGKAVAEAFAAGVWTLVEVVEARIRGHVYLELSERDAGGQQIAKAGAMIWSSTASKILPEFEAATGAVLGPGIKLLVRARPVFKANYGFSLEIDAIDPQYTLGDLEARKKDIRDRLQREGVFDANRRLPAPFDYRSVLVVAPQEGAGLGDFRIEAERLARHGVCRFAYAFSRFQGEGAAREIIAAMSAALEDFDRDAPPDAIVLIRGGGAVNDLAWLNDYDLARFICDQAVPVLTGIGHERDSTLPDEVAHTRFDTPSKVIAGIEHLVLQRAREAQVAAEQVFGRAARAAQRTGSDLDRLQAQVRADAQSHIDNAHHRSAQALGEVRIASNRQLHEAAALAADLSHRVQNDTRRHLADARQQVPALLADIRLQASAGLARAARGNESAFQAVLARADAGRAVSRRTVEDAMRRVAERAAGSIATARAGAEALMREVTGQGPDKTLARGFAIVRTPAGQAVTSRDQAAALPVLDIQFRDGALGAVPARTP
ncbi:exodeoxyribonuclease VII large subunit [Xylophilus sp. Kf1]|nr:exodeoxyribonuclease VII large subunit [Xylophilus sp. Kf1]